MLLRLMHYALPESCSQGAFILERIVKNCRVKGRKRSMAIKTVNGEVTIYAMELEGLKFQGDKVN